MFLGSKEAVLAMLQRLTESQPATEHLRIAVAFWGDGAEAVISPEKLYQIICNLLHGGTNPATIRSLRAMPNVEIRHLTGLHAKVVLAGDRAIVGSANFSADGLGLESPNRPGWIEAAAVIDGTDVKHWFEAQWQASSDVSDEALAQAMQTWAHRNRRPLRDDPSNAPDYPPPQLSESDLFKHEITGRNKIRMAARQIELIYFQEIEPESTRTVWNPAYASSLLWTEAGNRIQTKIDNCPYFERPSDVLERAKHPNTIEQVHRFIVVLSGHPDVSPAIRYWASHYLRNAT